MSFFNKKEEVLDIELTQLGKYQLAKGKFKPVYYAFSDDEILYNVGFVDDGRKYPENDKEASKRIQRDTQRTRNFYEHDGVESRVTGEDWRVDKIRGHHTVGRRKPRVGEYPVGEMYGTDTIEESMMGADDRNLIRNFIGNSSMAEQKIPSWDIDLLLGGNITNVNISSSSPNVGIQRPVLDVDEYTRLQPKTIPTINPNSDMDNEKFQRTYTGFEKVLNFVDGMSVIIEDGNLIFSVVEENTDYIEDNFEFELYRVVDKQQQVPGTTSFIEELEPLYFSDDRRYFNWTEQVSQYFEVLSDSGLADLYGFDLRGFDRNKIKDRFQKTISDQVLLDRMNRESELGDSELNDGRVIFRPGDIEDFCDDDPDGDIGG